MSARIAQDLDGRLPELMARAYVPGLSVAVIEEGQLAWSGSFGVKRRDSAGRVDDDTVFQAASLSKPAFAFAVMQLVTRGTITLDTPLSTYLPQPYVPDDALLERVTTRHVLSHVTGWPNWRPTGQDLRRNAPPGERFGYSGEGYVYLQRVVEHVTGRSLEELMQTDVLTPLGMLRSSFIWARPEDPAIAGAHDRDGAPVAPYSGEHANAAPQPARDADRLRLLHDHVSHSAAGHARRDAAAAGTGQRKRCLGPRLGSASERRG
jgi:CubicO group peptidase (beta-lactamase class C family)